MSAITNGNTPELKADEFVTVSFQVQRKRLPAFRSALGDIAGQIGTQLTRSMPFPKAQALTDAAIALGALRRATKEYGYSEWYEK